MGLSQDDAIWRPDRHWLLPAALIVIALLLQAGGEPVRLALQYDNNRIADGEFLRLLSGHLVHLGWSHALLNVAGLLLVWTLVGGGFGAAQWLAVVLASMASIDAGLWLLLPQLDWYVGLSGVLHGVLSAGIVGLWPARRAESLILAAALILKLVYEALVGPMPGSEQAAGGPVVTLAHLCGAIGGAAVAWPMARARPAVRPASGPAGR